MGRFDGKVVFVTGAARGQGQLHAVRFAEEGADIVAVDLCAQVPSVAYPMATPDDLALTVKLVEETGRRIVARHADVRNVEALATAVDEGVSALGRIDVVLANAGIMPIAGPHSLERAAWLDAVDIMLTGVFNTVEVAAPHLVDQAAGVIIITSSTAGLKGFPRSVATATPGFLGYHAAKHGVVGLMRCYANAFASSNIRVNTVHPTGVSTPMAVNEEFPAWVSEHPEVVPAITNALDVPMIEAVDVTNAVLWLCSDEARYVTGVAFPVDAGATIR